MADLLFPTWVPIAEAEWRLVDFTGRSSTTLSGAQKRVTRGQRLGVSYRLQNLSAADRHAVMAWAAALRGGYGTAILYDPANRQRGTFPGGELLSNSTFASGTTGWTGVAAGLTVQDRVLRITASQAYNGVNVPQALGSAVATQYATYAGRAFISAGRGSLGTCGPYIGDSVGATAEYGATGLRTAVRTVLSTGIDFSIVGGNASSGYGADDYVSCSYTSFARCAMVDAGPNLLLQSQTLQTTWTTSGCNAIVQNVVAAPDGTTTADGLQENGATSEHYITQTYTKPAAAADYVLSVYAKQDGSRHLQLYLTEGGANAASCNFNLSTGAVSGSPGTSGTFSNARAFVAPAGNGWFRCILVVRTGTGTSLAANAYILNSGFASNYAGDNASGLRLWGASLAQSSTPVRYTATTTATTSGSTSAGLGYAYLKGLLVSTNGLVLAGDRVEVNGELKIATADLNSDAAGLGYLQFEPVLRTAPADNAPVIIGQPMGRFVLQDDASWTTRPGMFSDITLNFLEA